MLRTFGMAVGDWRLFLRLWLRTPLTVGAIAPSGEALALAMVDAAGPLRGPVLELGAGTGVFTRALLRSGLAPADLHAVERLPEFADALRLRFPEIDVITTDAAELRRDRFPRPVNAIVSGLPLRAMRAAQVECIVRRAFACAREDARFVQFSYGFRCPVPATLQARLGIESRRVAWVGRNLPPASVWTLRRARLGSTCPARSQSESGA